MKLIYTRNVFCQTANKTVSNTVTETSLIGTGVGSLVIPADALIVGNTIRVQLRGFLSTTGSPNIDFNFKFGSTSVVTMGPSAAGTNVDNKEFSLWYTFTIRGIGTSGSIIGQSQVLIFSTHGTRNTYDIEMTSPVTINTTIDQTIDVTCTWGTADVGDTITSTNCLVEILN